MNRYPILVEKANLIGDDDYRNQAIAKRLESVRYPRLQAVSLNQEQAITYAEGRVCFRSGEIRILDSNGAVECTIPFTEADRKL